MQRIKDLKQRQRIFDDLDEVSKVPDFLDKLNRNGMSPDDRVSPEQFRALCTIEGISDQIDGHLAAKNMHGFLYWYDVDGLIQRAAVDFDFI